VGSAFCFMIPRWKHEGSLECLDLDGEAESEAAYSLAAAGAF